MRVLQTRAFEKAVKRFPRKEKAALDAAVKTVIDDPDIGDHKIGDLSGVSVYKFKVGVKQYLLAYQYDDEQIILTLIA